MLVRKVLNEVAVKDGEPTIWSSPIGEPFEFSGEIPTEILSGFFTIEKSVFYYCQVPPLYQVCDPV